MIEGNCVLREGVEQLDQDKLSPLLRLRYRALDDAFLEIGKPGDVRRLFVGFQRHLYEQRLRTPGDN